MTSRFITPPNDLLVAEPEVAYALRDAGLWKERAAGASGRKQHAFLCMARGADGKLCRSGRQRVDWAEREHVVRHLLGAHGDQARGIALGVMRKIKPDLFVWERLRDSIRLARVAFDHDTQKVQQISEVLHRELGSFLQELADDPDRSSFRFEPARGGFWVDLPRALADREQSLKHLADLLTISTSAPPDKWRNV